MPSRIREPLLVPKSPNHTWSMDFMSDALTDGRKIRVFNLTDDYNREALAIEVALGFPANRVVRSLEIMEEEYGLSKHSCGQ